MSFWLAVSCGIAWAFVAYVSSIKPLDLAETERALKWVRGGTETVQWMTSSIGIFAAAAPALGLVWRSYRRTKRVISEQIERRGALLQPYLDIDFRCRAEEKRNTSIPHSEKTARFP